MAEGMLAKFSWASDSEDDDSFFTEETGEYSCFTAFTAGKNLERLKKSSMQISEILTPVEIRKESSKSSKKSSSMSESRLPHTDEKAIAPKYEPLDIATAIERIDKEVKDMIAIFGKDEEHNSLFGIEVCFC